MNTLIEGLLEITRIEAGKVDILYEATDVRQTLDVVMSNLADKINAKELEFQILIPPDFPSIHVGLKQLTQILFNLIGNAVKYVDAKGRVIIRMVVEEAMVLVSVEDSGPGMDEETLKHIFEMYWRGDKFRKTIAGTGLGLAVSKLLVEMMGGRIWVKSELGVGSTFYFTVQQWREK
ncbi:sensor histidine kinase [Candidatus Magnetominusculus dajiuhuensis]|uniref:sensor histidine kinase n=1 Tax=Candidatus Magnetominusculus dajiuhuensis TaxID=3137712 RepID=UPI003B438E53